jgi:hypothetical protein
LGSTVEKASFNASISALSWACISASFGPYPPEELYDLQKDPAQISNLAHDSKSAEDLQVMRSRLDELWKVSLNF